MKSVDHIIIGGGINGLIASKNKIGTCALRPPLAGILMYSPGEESTR
jgi:hypothetical protein